MQFLGPDAFSLADFRSLLEKRDHTRRQLMEESAAKEAQIREMVAALGQENDSLKAQVASLEGQVRKGDQAFKQNQHLANVVRTKDEEIRRLSEEVQQLRAEAAKRENERASLQAKVQKLMKQVLCRCCCLLVFINVTYIVVTCLYIYDLLVIMYICTCSGVVFVFVVSLHVV